MATAEHRERGADQEPERDQPDDPAGLVDRRQALGVVELVLDGRRGRLAQVEDAVLEPGPLLRLRVDVAGLAVPLGDLAERLVIAEEQLDRHPRRAGQVAERLAADRFEGDGPHDGVGLGGAQAKLAAQADEDLLRQRPLDGLADHVAAGGGLRRAGLVGRDVGADDVARVGAGDAPEQVLAEGAGADAAPQRPGRRRTPAPSTATKPTTATAVRARARRGGRTAARK